MPKTKIKHDLPTQLFKGSTDFQAEAFSMLEQTDLFALHSIEDVQRVFISQASCPYFEIKFDYQIQQYMDDPKAWEKEWKKDYWGMNDDFKGYFEFDKPFNGKYFVSTDELNIADFYPFYKHLEECEYVNFEGTDGWSNWYYGGYVYPIFENNTHDWYIDFNTNAQPPSQTELKWFRWKQIESTMVAVYDNDLDLDLTQELDLSKFDSEEIF